jgi:hypothetical protein
MLRTYAAILRDNRLEWSGEAPADLPPDSGVRVLVTLLERLSKVSIPGQGERMAEALEHLAASQSLRNILDAADWERDQRIDRPLPGRDS